MDSLRTELISRHMDEMDGGLVNLLQRYRDFTERTKPRIAVLCSDNMVRMEMEQLFPTRNDVDAAVYGTFSGEDHFIDTMMCDAVVAVTGALHIAAKGMYDALERLSVVSKEVYVLLGGWGSLPRTEQLRVSKTARVPEEFPLSRIISVKNYFPGEQEGFLTPEQAVEEAVVSIIRSFERIHKDQEEQLYSWLRKQVAEFYEKSIAGIRDELILVKNNCRVIAAKQELYALKLTHSAVSMQDLTDLAGKRIGQITLYDMEDMAGNLTWTIKEDRREAERTMKHALADLVEKALDSCMGDSDSPVRIKSRATMAECRGVMEGIRAEISNAKYISPELKQAFSDAVEDSSDLDKIVDQYDEMARMTYDRARKRILAAVKAYQYGRAPGLRERVIDVGKKVLVPSDLKSESGKLPPEDMRGKEFDYGDTGGEYSDDILAEAFYKDTENMRKEVTGESFRMIDECGREVTGEINRYSESMIKGYFTRAAAALEQIERYLEKLPDLYIWE